MMCHATLASMCHARSVVSTSSQEWLMDDDQVDQIDEVFSSVGGDD